MGIGIPYKGVKSSRPPVCYDARVQLTDQSKVKHPSSRTPIDAQFPGESLIDGARTSHGGGFRADPQWRATETRAFCQKSAGRIIQFNQKRDHHRNKHPRISLKAFCRLIFYSRGRSSPGRLEVPRLSYANVPASFCLPVVRGSQRRLTQTAG